MQLYPVWSSSYIIYYDAFCKFCYRHLHCERRPSLLITALNYYITSSTASCITWSVRFFSGVSPASTLLWRLFGVGWTSKKMNQIIDFDTHVHIVHLHWLRVFLCDLERSKEHWNIPFSERVAIFSDHCIFTSFFRRVFLDGVATIWDRAGAAMSFRVRLFWL